MYYVWLVETCSVWSYLFGENLSIYYIKQKCLSVILTNYMSRDDIADDLLHTSRNDVTDVTQMT